MEIKVVREEVDGVPVVVPVGEVDVGTVTALAEHLRYVLEDIPRLVLVDLTRLAFMDSSGVHALVNAEQAMSAYGGRLAVVAGADNIYDVFALTGALILFTLHRTRAEALGTLRLGTLELN